MPPLETSQDSTDKPRSRTPTQTTAPKNFIKTALKPLSSAASPPVTSPTLAPRVSVSWHPDGARAWRDLAKADATLLARAALTRTLKSALERVLGASAPAPLHVALAREISARPSYGYEVAVTLYDDELTRETNRDHRGKDQPTDVLSYAIWEGFAFPGAPDEPLIALGDLVISIETAARQARELGHDLRAELAFLAVHGALHLLGHDHGTAWQRRRMFALQDEIVGQWREEKGF